MTYVVVKPPLEPYYFPQIYRTILYYLQFIIDLFQIDRIEIKVVNKTSSMSAMTPEWSKQSLARSVEPVYPIDLDSQLLKISTFPQGTLGAGFRIRP